MFNWRDYRDIMPEHYQRYNEAIDRIMAEENARRERESIIREALERFRLEIVDNASPTIKALVASIDAALSGH